MAKEAGWGVMASHVAEATLPVLVRHIACSGAQAVKMAKEAGWGVMASHVAEATLPVLARRR